MSRDGRQNGDSEIIGDDVLDDVLDEIIGSRKLAPATVRGPMPSSRPRPEEEHWALRLPEAERPLTGRVSDETPIVELPVRHPCRVIGLLLWGVDDSTVIRSFRIGNTEQIVQSVPGLAFAAQESWERFTLRLRPTRDPSSPDLDRDRWTEGRFANFKHDSPSFTWLDFMTAAPDERIALDYRGSLSRAVLIARVLPS